MDKSVPDTVDVLDGITDLSTHLLLITLHLGGKERRSLKSGYRRQTRKTVNDERQHEEEKNIKSVIFFVQRVCTGADNGEATWGSFKRMSYSI